MNTLVRLSLLTLAASLLTGCVSFEREWRLWKGPDPAPRKGQVAIWKRTVPSPTAQSPFDGRWEGRWTSNRHKKLFSRETESGSLRCIFTQIDPYRYRANFRAGWMLGHSDMITELYGHRRGNVLHLKGEAPIGIFGTYRYHGTVTPERFTLNYDASYDTGTFEMRKLR